ncbi:MAG: 2-oxo acid dehydrogenase subunit E2 [Rhizomicrobium sp.]
MASVAAMKVAPAVNGRWYDDRIDIYDDVNIGIGTALGEKGLIVPVIHRAQSLSLLEIAKALTDVTERARGGKLNQDDVRGGTSPSPTTAYRARWLPRPSSSTSRNLRSWVSESLRSAPWCAMTGSSSAPMAYVTLTIDHRVIDAFQTNAWLTKFVETLENRPSEA